MSIHELPATNTQSLADRLSLARIIKRITIVAFAVLFLLTLVQLRLKEEQMEAASKAITILNASRKINRGMSEKDALSRVVYPPDKVDPENGFEHRTWSTLYSVGPLSRALGFHSEQGHIFLVITFDPDGKVSGVSVQEA